MKFLIAAPDNNYSLWQILVQQNNFMKFGYDVDTIYVIDSDEPSSILKSIMESQKIKAKFHVYKDTRELKTYKTSTRPHIIEKFYNEYPEMENEVIFYTDNDVLFTKPIDFTSMISDDSWHCSNASSYVGIDYLLRNSDELFIAKMFSVVGYNSNLIKNIPAGGAQYIMKGVNAEFWRKCYDDMEKMYSLLAGTKIVKYKAMLINSWCADMWVVLWNSIMLYRDVMIEPSLSFSWATDDISKWDKNNIFHNAGRVRGIPGYFNKGDFIDISPFDKNIEVSNSNCTFNYVNEIRDTENNFRELIW